MASLRLKSSLFIASFTQLGGEWLQVIVDPAGETVACIAGVHGFGNVFIKTRGGNRTLPSRNS
jgi:hypothetical protein